MSFHDILFPSCLEVFLVGKSAFSTSKIISSSGREIRSLDHAQIRGQYLLKDCFLSESDFAVFNNFFKARRGSRFAFMLRDFSDFTVKKQIFAVGDGASRDFQLFKEYQDEKHPYVRKITKVKRDSLEIYIDQRQENNWQFNENTGLLSLDTPLAQGSILYGSFEFYIVVRFAEDSFDYESRSDGTIEILNVSLIEVLE